MQNHQLPFSARQKAPLVTSECVALATNARASCYGTFVNERRNATTPVLSRGSSKYLRRYLNWLEHQPSKLGVAGSSPVLRSQQDGSSFDALAGVPAISPALTSLEVERGSVLPEE